MDQQKNSFLGIGKNLYHSGACKVLYENNLRDVELILTERLTRKKSDGTWPYLALENLKINDITGIGDNRDVITPSFYEDVLNKEFPFYAFLEKKGLSQLLHQNNDSITTVGHHLAHAYSCVGMSPFDEAIIVIMDGAGSEFHDGHEEYTAYHFKSGVLECIDYSRQQFRKGSIDRKRFTNGAGLFYENMAEFIFNSNHATGKVMGLSVFSEPVAIDKPYEFLNSMPWDISFDKSGKTEWENSENLELFKSYAATAQWFYENTLFKRVERLKEKFPDIDNLIIAGGCALNCIANWKLRERGLFSNIYVPSMPDDRGTSFGIATYLSLKNGINWKRVPYKEQSTFWGKKDSSPKEVDILNTFKDFKITKPDNIYSYTADKIAEDKVLAWFQGRSEIGSRALGNRSIIAKVNRPNLKNYLNENIKFRESFRPYACSIIQEKVSTYFSVEDSFQAPYMSFAVPVKEKYLKEFKEVCHIDNTSRLQTVMEEQNKRYYELIKHVGEKTGIYGILNTSLNIMGEPIIETIFDLKKFFENSVVDGIIVGDFYIEK